MDRPITLDRQGTILTVTFHRDPTDAEHISHLEEMDAVIDDGKWGQVHRWVVINEMRVLIQANASHRKRQAEWMKRRQEELRNRTSGVAFVMQSALMRGGLTAVFWLAPLPCGHAIFKTLEEATAWARERDSEPVSPDAVPPRRRAAGSLGTDG